MDITTRYNAYQGVISDNGRITLDNHSDFYRYIHDITNALQEDFPALFPSKPKAKLPLKLGIHKDLEVWAESNGISSRNLSLLLHYWCRGKRYQKAQKFGQRLGVRFGLGSAKDDVRIYGWKSMENSVKTLESQEFGKVCWVL